VSDEECESLRAQALESVSVWSLVVSRAVSECLDDGGTAMTANPVGASQRRAVRGSLLTAESWTGADRQLKKLLGDEHLDDDLRGRVAFETRCSERLLH
jgi:hypothetical protein